MVIVMDFPLLRNFEVSSTLITFLNRKFEQCKKEEIERSVTPYPKNSFDERKEYQTQNILEWDDEEIKTFNDNELKKIVSDQLKLNESQIKYHYIHFLDYEKGGSMALHNHVHNEDFVLFIYLKDCDGGNTVFYLNNYDEVSMERTEVSLRPRNCGAAIFSALVMHLGRPTEENKRIFVVGIKVNTQGC